MNKKEFINVQLLSPRSLYRVEDMTRSIRKQCELLPEYLPQKFDWKEPIRQPFDPEHPEAVVHSNGVTETTLWKRTGKDRADGAWRVRWSSTVSGYYDTHSSIEIRVYSEKYQTNLISFLQKMSIEAAVDVAYIDARTDLYAPFGRRNGITPYSIMSLVTHYMRHWFPDMLWAMVFGKPYIDLFGQERLLSVPAYKVEELAEDKIFVQLTPSLNDLFDNFDTVMKAREAAKQHLGPECFFQEKLAYEWREHPEKAGKVFRVPKFKLIEDIPPPPRPVVTWR